MVKNFQPPRTMMAGRRLISRKPFGDSGMRPICYAIAFVLLVTAPSLAGSADRDLPGIGAFSYNGSPVVTSAPARLASVEMPR
jgi:hypothetical protein